MVGGHHCGVIYWLVNVEGVWTLQPVNTLYNIPWILANAVTLWWVVNAIFCLGSSTHSIHRPFRENRNFVVPVSCKYWLFKPNQQLVMPFRHLQINCSMLLLCYALSFYCWCYVPVMQRKILDLIPSSRQGRLQLLNPAEVSSRFRFIFKYSS